MDRELKEIKQPKNRSQKQQNIVEKSKNTNCTENFEVCEEMNREFKATSRSERGIEKATIVKLIKLKKYEQKKQCLSWKKVGGSKAKRLPANVSRYNSSGTRRADLLRATYPDTL